MESKNVTMSKEEACSFALSIATSSTLPMVLKTLIELDVLEMINRAGPETYLSPAQIAAQISTKNPDAASMLDRMLRVLASNSIVSCTLQTLPDGRVQRLYGRTAVSEFFAKDPGFGHLAIQLHKRYIVDAWYCLKDSILNGGHAFNKAHNMSLFEYFGRNDVANAHFNEGMSNYATIIVEKMVENYDGFEGLSTIVDVGGGIGATLNTIISKYPKIKGINFDLPRVIENAPTYDGIEHVAGDMFVSVPQADAIFMKWIIHDWSDGHSLKILKNCYAALPKDGKVILCDYILPVAPITSDTAKVGFNFDARMMVTLVGGKERTEQEFEALAKHAGFKTYRVVCSAYDLKVMELSKK